MWQIAVSESVTYIVGGNKMSVESTKSIIEQKVIENMKLITHTTNEVTLNDSLESLQVNSLMFIKIIIALEEEFGIEFGDDKLLITAFPLVGDFVIYLKEVLGGEYDDSTFFNK
jgi:acyl carrier protein